MKNTEKVDPYELKRIIIMLYQCALKKSPEQEKTFELKHLTFPLNAHDRQKIYNMTISKREFDVMLYNYMVDIDEDLFLSKQIVTTKKFEKFLDRI